MGEMDSEPQKLIIMRHAERVDFTFGSWINQSFSDNGNYIRKNLNMPVSIPKRHLKDYCRDTPLTRIGNFQAYLVGENMKENKIKFSHVFCSPSLRCVETCKNVLKGTHQEHLLINIEPGLFEWCGWYKDYFPKFLPLDDLESCGFNVSKEYKPVISADDLSGATAESSEEFYMRSFLVTKTLLNAYDGNLFFVGHAATLDTCSRQLVGGKPRNYDELHYMVKKIMYAAVAMVEKNSENGWQLIDPPLLPLKHTANGEFNWRMLLE